MQEMLPTEPGRNEEGGKVDSGERRSEEGIEGWLSTAIKERIDQYNKEGLCVYYPPGVSKEDLERAREALKSASEGMLITLPKGFTYVTIRSQNRIWLVRYNTFCMIVVVAKDEAQAKERYYNWLRDNDFIGLHTAACLSDFYDLMVSEPCMGNWKLLEVGVSTLPDDKHYIDISLLNEVDNG